MKVNTHLAERNNEIYHLLHEVVLPVLASILVAIRGHIVLSEQRIIGMVFLVLLFFPLFCLLNLFFLLRAS